MSFEIIAIKPLKGRKPEYLRILKPRVIYYFNNSYRIDTRDKIKLCNTLPNNFYTNGRPAINISAVVGKNGAGKSSLMDLMLRSLNNLGKKYDKLDLDLQFVTGVDISIYFKIEENIYKLHCVSAKVDIYKFKQNGQRERKPLPEIYLKQLFYTVIINYSHYAYNIQDFLEEGNWLEGLFHKNDGYQTPVVINPFRNKGNIEINNEHHLAKSRLISNFLAKRNGEVIHFRKISENQEAHSLKLTLGASKENAALYMTYTSEIPEGVPVTLKSLKIDRESILQKLDKYYYFNYKALDKEKFKVAVDYILYKLVSISTKYSDYKSFYNTEKHDFIYTKLELFFDTLLSDDSHITFKLKQTLNFLKYQHLELKNQEITFDQLSTIIIALRKRHKGFFEISHFIPPPIFQTEILLKVKSANHMVHFSKLSSGEKQMLYSVSSLLYHLKNLDSIRNSKRRTAYKYVNAVLEEVELYFHPEMQRSYVQFILDCIEKLQLRAIRAVNIIFVTHSPFILSDIPDSKVLFLEQDGLPKQIKKGLKTFGGNIHDLLADSFFLGQGFIGQFAKTKIQSIIDDLNNAGLHNKKANPDVRALIELIGEPFLREKLMEMYFKTVPGDVSKSKRIQELEEELNRLRND